MTTDRLPNPKPPGDDDDDTLVLICMRVTDAKPGCVSDHSIKETCGECATPVWFATDSQARRAAATGPVKVVCLPCWLARASKREVLEALGNVTREQIEHCSRHIAKLRAESN